MIKKKLRLDKELISSGADSGLDGGTGPTLYAWCTITCPTNYTCNPAACPTWYGCTYDTCAETCQGSNPCEMI